MGVCCPWKMGETMMMLMMMAARVTSREEWCVQLRDDGQGTANGSGATPKSSLHTCLQSIVTICPWRNMKKLEVTHKVETHVTHDH